MLSSSPIPVLRLGMVMMFGLLAFGVRAQSPVITTQPSGLTASVGGTVVLTASAQGASSVQWRRNGNDLPGAASASLTLNNFQVADAGLYTAAFTNSSGTIESSPAIVGVSSVLKVNGAGLEVGHNIVHPSLKIYDQVLLTGPAATITADPNKTTRVSFIDLSDDIVQVEFSGAGTLTLTLDSASAPAAPLKYNQPGVLYMKGHASLIICGADNTTNVTVFTVGRMTAVNQALFPTAQTYDGVADIGVIAIASVDGKFGGVRAANASMTDVAGFTGVYAPGVTVLGPVYVEQIIATANATPVMIFGGTSVVQVTGGNLLQSNGRAVQVSGITELDFENGMTSDNKSLTAQASRAALQQNGSDVTSQLLNVNPVPISQTRPLYPFAMRAAGIQGNVTVDFIVDAKGLVQNAYGLNYSRIEFVAESLTAVNQWIFKPGRKNGLAAPYHMQVPIIFTLNG